MCHHYPFAFSVFQKCPSVSLQSAKETHTHTLPATWARFRGSLHLKTNVDRIDPPASIRGSYPKSDLECSVTLGHLRIGNEVRCTSQLGSCSMSSTRAPIGALCTINVCKLSGGTKGQWLNRVLECSLTLVSKDPPFAPLRISSKVRPYLDQLSGEIHLGHNLQPAHLTILLYCYWVGSLDFHFLGFPSCFLLTSNKNILFAGGSTAPKI